MKDNHDSFMSILANILNNTKFPDDVLATVDGTEGGEPKHPFEYAILDAVEFGAEQGYVEFDSIRQHPQLRALFCSYCGKLHDRKHCPQLTHIKSKPLKKGK